MFFSTNYLLHYILKTQQFSQLVKNLKQARCKSLFFFNFKIFNSYMHSQTWTPLPPPAPQHLSGSSPCTSPKHAAPYVRHRLAIQFLHDSIHVRMTFSQIIPPSPSPSESKSLFYTSVSFFLSCIQGRHCHLPKFHIYVLVYCIGVFLSGLLHSV